MNIPEDRIEDSYKIYFDDEGVFRLDIVSELFNPKSPKIQAAQIREKVLKIVEEKSGRKFPILVDITGGENGTIANIESRKVYLDLLKRAKSSFSKFAVYGKTKTYKIIMSSLFMFAKKNIGGLEIEKKQLSG